MKQIPDAVTGYLDRLIDDQVTACYSAALSYKGAACQTARGTVLSSNHSEISVRPDTPFNIGSVTKIITATLAVKLAEKGALSLDDSISRYVPEYRYPHTILQLMLHTAGFLPPDSLPWPTPDRLSSYKFSIYNHPVSEAADRSAVYYTQGYTILMDVIEKAGGMELENFAKAELFGPLGMSDTTFRTDHWESGTYVLPYDSENREPVPELEGLAVTGDSGLYSTAGDLLRFAEMILAEGQFGGRRVLSEAAARLLMREVTNRRFQKTPVMWVKGERDSYGCFGDLLSPSAMGHPGFSGCMLVIDPELQFAGVLLTNSQKLHADWTNYRKLWNTAVSSLLAE